MHYLLDRGLDMSLYDTINDLRDLRGNIRHAATEPDPAAVRTYVEAVRKLIALLRQIQ
jgi:hypothetical protein